MINRDQYDSGKKSGGGGGVNSVTASGPLVSSGGANPNISLPGILTHYDCYVDRNADLFPTLAQVRSGTYQFPFDRTWFDPSASFAGSLYTVKIAGWYQIEFHASIRPDLNVGNWPNDARLVATVNQPRNPQDHGSWVLIRSGFITGDALGTSTGVTAKLSIGDTIGCIWTTNDAGSANVIDYVINGNGTNRMLVRFLGPDPT